MSVDDKAKEDFEWDTRSELLLFHSMIGHKPVGVNRHFMMACIHDKFTRYIKKPVSSKVIWDHLDTMYDMEALHESEVLPFPNEEKEFELPESEFSSLMQKKIKATRAASETEPNSDVELKKPKPRKKAVSIGPKQIQLVLSPLKKKESTVSEKSSHGVHSVLHNTKEGPISSRC